jgi:hypothetical protein
MNHLVFFGHHEFSLQLARFKITVFWYVAPCSLVEVYRHFRGGCCLHHQSGELFIALMMEAESTSKTSVNFYQATRRNIPEDSHLHTRRRENLKSHLDGFSS